MDWLIIGMVGSTPVVIEVDGSAPGTMPRWLGLFVICVPSALIAWGFTVLLNRLFGGLSWLVKLFIVSPIPLLVFLIFMVSISMLASGRGVGETISIMFPLPIAGQVTLLATFLTGALVSTLVTLRFERKASRTEKTRLDTFK